MCRTRQQCDRVRLGAHLQFHVALLTPFDARGRVDLARLRAHVLWLAAQGIEGFVPTASAGEFLYLSDREREAIHRTVLDAARGRSVTPCTWDPSPATMGYLTDAAREQGATAVLVPPPLYYPLDDTALRQWFESVADKRLPVIGYHNPHRLQSHISAQLYRDLRSEGVLAGLIDSSQDRYRLKRIAAEDPGAVFAGGDLLLPSVHELGQLAGIVSRLANVWPQFCLRLFKEREVQLEDALIDRVNRVRRAGGLRALKSLLRMGCRAPLVEPPDEALMGLPPAEGP